MSPKPLVSPAGTRDLVGLEKNAIDNIRQAILSEFRRHGCVLVQPPVIDNVEPFVDRSGEEIRQRMYTFQDPTGRQLCLRPELTIPTCRLYLEHCQAQQHPQRLCYDGLVFRYDPVSFGRYREFHQVGVEYFGCKAMAAADAEAVGLAYRGVAACGVSGLQVWLNDFELIAVALDELEVPLATRDRIAARFSAPDVLDALQQQAQQRPSPDQTALETAPGFEGELANLRADNVRQFVRKIMALTNTKELGSRSIEEIAERMVAKLERQAGTELSPRADACLRTLLSVEGPAGEAVSRLASIASEFQLKRVADLVERFRVRLECLDALGVPASCLFVKTRLRRTLQYYTGFMFELHAPCLGGASEVCGGGRYDHLLRSLGAAQDIPAIGFAIGVDRVYLTLCEQPTISGESSAGDQASASGQSSDSGQSSTAAGTSADLASLPMFSNPSPIDAVLTPAGPVAMGECFRIASLARAAGWSVEVELDGRRPKSAIAKAARHEVPHMIIVGADELARGGVNVKDLSSHEERFVALGDLPSFIAARRTAKSATQT
ncbi:MAG: histidine--tRNA ligase, partial [Planctomycetota bacterium]